MAFIENPTKSFIDMVHLSRAEKPSGPLEYLDLSEAGRKIPVYDIRSVGSHEEIARQIADGAQMALFGGVWGGFKGVKRGVQNEGFFMRVKPGRPKEAKVAMMVPPSDAIQLIDWSLVHPKFRYLRDYEKFRDLWSANEAYLHIIVPIKSSLRALPEIFETTPEDFRSRYPSLDPVNVSTACFFWREDPYLKHFTALVKRLSHTTVYVGVSSLNRHKEKPHYLYGELVDQIKNGRANPVTIHLIVRDSIYEKYEAFGSHTQLRLPLNNETPKLKVIRIGTLSPEGFESKTGLSTEILSGAEDVRRNPGVNIDDQLQDMSKEIKENWRKQKAKVFFRD